MKGFLYIQIFILTLFVTFIGCGGGESIDPLFVPLYVGDLTGNNTVVDGVATYYEVSEIDNSTLFKVEVNGSDGLEVGTHWSVEPASLGCFSSEIRSEDEGALYNHFYPYNVTQDTDGVIKTVVNITEHGQFERTVNIRIINDLEGIQDVNIDWDTVEHPIIITICGGEATFELKVNDVILEPFFSESFLNRFPFTIFDGYFIPPGYEWPSVPIQETKMITYLGYEFTLNQSPSYVSLLGLDLGSPRDKGSIRIGYGLDVSCNNGICMVPFYLGRGFGMIHEASSQEWHLVEGESTDFQIHNINQ